MRRGETPESFQGFEHLEANFLYCPNQFLDLCIPNCSRSCVRLVAYVLRESLGWVDENGEPINEHVSVPYHKVKAEAGISNKQIPRARKEAIKMGFLRCVQEARPNRKGAPAQTGMLALRWDEEGSAYCTDLSAFKGFYAGAGHVTRIPNGFFDHVVPKETLSRVKIVATVLRHTVGYENPKTGGRRAEAPLAYKYIQQYANIRDPKTLRENLKFCIEAGYIRVTTPGCTDLGGQGSRATRYAPMWLTKAKKSDNGVKTQRESLNGVKNPAGTV